MHILKKIIPAVVLCGAAISMAHPALAYSLNFDMVNGTNQAITNVWTSPVSDNNWGPAATNIDVPDNDGDQEITFNYGASGDSCYYDIRVQFEQGDTSVIPNVNLCATRTLSVDVDNSGEVTYDAQS